jgi:tRNA pseudouridine13 synthase
MSAADPVLRPPALVLAPPGPPRRACAGAVPEGARIKERAGDFLVEELQLYEPSGEGEHLYLRIVKQDTSHHEMVSVLCRHFGVPPRAIGVAGMKDRVAVTSQTVSIHLPKRPELKSIPDDRLQVLWATWHANKLRPGHLAGNRFSVRIRGIEPFAAPGVWRAIRAMESEGVPNGFGPQRFGMRGNNHLLGALLLLGRHEELLGELLGTGGSAFPASEEDARRCADAGAFDEAARLLPRGLDAERMALRALARGADARTAVRAVPRDIRVLWVDAWQSAVFNRVLDRRLAAGALHRVGLGDVAIKHPNGAQFAVDDAAMSASGDASIEARAGRFEISASGPLPGPGAVGATGAVLEEEHAAIRAFGIDPAQVDGTRSGDDGPGGARRPLRVRLSNPELESGFDEHGPYVRVAFDLPPGAFATAVLREALGDGMVDASRAAERS